MSLNLWRDIKHIKEHALQSRRLFEFGAKAAEARGFKGRIGRHPEGHHRRFGGCLRRVSEILEGF